MYKRSGTTYNLQRTSSDDIDLDLLSACDCPMKCLLSQKALTNFTGQSLNNLLCESQTRIGGWLVG